MTLLRHPSISPRFESIFYTFVVPDLEDRSVQIAVEVVRRTARGSLKDREVKHFEVVHNQVEGYRAVPHTECEGSGCDECSGAGYMFMVDRGAEVMTMGWVAVVRRVA